MNAVTIIRGLLAAGWQSNSHTDMADGSVVLDCTRGDSTITAAVGDDGTTGLMLTGLTVEQVAAALTAVGHMPPIPTTPHPPRLPEGWNSTSRSALGIIRRQDVADLGDVASGRVPLPPTGGAL